MAETISDIVLIGPVRTGKSTLGRLPEQRLSLPQVSVDELRWKYYKEIGYNEALAKKFRDLARFTVYTKGKTPDETCAEILALTAPDKIV